MTSDSQRPPKQAPPKKAFNERKGYQGKPNTKPPTLQQKPQVKPTKKK